MLTSYINAVFFISPRLVTDRDPRFCNDSDGHDGRDDIGKDKNMSRYVVMALTAMLLTLTGCAHYYGLVETDASLMTECDCIGTFAETSNPGREDGGFMKHYVDTTGVQQRVLKRAAMAGATHVVWMHTYSVGAAAQAYRCPGAKPLMTAGTDPDGLWKQDRN